jgi:hypothetical protein
VAEVLEIEDGIGGVPVLSGLRVQPVELAGAVSDQCQRLDSGIAIVASRVAGDELVVKET